MDITKLFALLCGFLLIICLTLSITCLVVMRNAVEESSLWQTRAQALVNELDGCVQAMKEMETQDLPVIAPDTNEQENSHTRYRIRLDGDRIGVYDSDGYLIQHADLLATLLPPPERQRLQEGIWVDSWEKVGRLLQDYE